MYLISLILYLFILKIYKINKNVGYVGCVGYVGQNDPFSTEEGGVKKRFHFRGRPLLPLQTLHTLHYVIPYVVFSPFFSVVMYLHQCRVV